MRCRTITQASRRFGTSRSHESYHPSFLTSDKPWDLQVGTTGSLFPAWLAAQDRLAAQLKARHITQTNSSHGIAVEQPQIVVNAIRDVVDQIRGANLQ